MQGFVRVFTRAWEGCVLVEVYRLLLVLQMLSVLICGYMFIIVRVASTHVSGRVLKQVSVPTLPCAYFPKPSEPRNPNPGHI